MYRLASAPGIVQRIADGAFIPVDAPGNLDCAEYLAWLAGGNSPEPAPTPAQPALEERVVQLAQERLDAWAATRNYDGILSLCTYATSTVPRFRAEGTRGVEMRDATWAKCYEILAEVQAGQRPLPTLDQVVTQLPELTWTT